MKGKSNTNNFFRNAKAEEKNKSTYASRNFTNDARNNYNIKRGKTK